MRRNVSAAPGRVSAGLGCTRHGGKEQKESMVLAAMIISVPNDHGNIWYCIEIEVCRSSFQVWYSVKTYWLVQVSDRNLLKPCFTTQSVIHPLKKESDLPEGVSMKKLWCVYVWFYCNIFQVHGIFLKDCYCLLWDFKTSHTAKNTLKGLN